jgi:hypothetical protein
MADTVETGLAVTLEIYLREVVGSNLRPDTGYSDVSCCFPQSRKADTSWYLDQAMTTFFLFFSPPPPNSPYGGHPTIRRFMC